MRSNEVRLVESLRGENWMKMHYGRQLRGSCEVFGDDVGIVSGIVRGRVRDGVGLLQSEGQQHYLVDWKKI